MLYLLDPPSVPDTVSVQSATNDSATIQWNKPQCGWSGCILPHLCSEITTAICIFYCVACVYHQYITDQRQYH